MFKARDKKTNKKFIAMKKVLMDNEKEGVSFFILYNIIQQQLFNVTRITNYISYSILFCSEYILL